MQKLALPLETITFSGELQQLVPESWFDDGYIPDMDQFVETISCIKSKGFRPDLIGSFITNFAYKFLPGLSGSGDERAIANLEVSPESVTTSWMKKRVFVETLVAILPPEKESIPCNFLLRLLPIANMVGVDPLYRDELEKRVSWHLDQASLDELMIPSFSHTCTTLLDVELVLRMVTRFVHMDGAARSGAALVKVARLVDWYLAEAATDSNLTLSQFVALATALPSHVRAADDALYRAVDMYLKAHPGMSKQERKSICKLVDSKKLSPEASLHVVQNERVPIRAIIQVLLSEQSKINKHIDWGGSFRGTRIPNPQPPEPLDRCLSMNKMNTQQMEIKRLKEDVLRLQSQCMAMEGQIERLLEKKKGIINWKKLVNFRKIVKSKFS
ncbi:Phototropic-responsive NPH3 family protein [Abeliophyllum distichum]|uniref:Phototropic-responsive NPH3 family protein n=1 Tax=Abeliophyllum distichum TaxID=126358 RepID=A0ABD1VPM1_9LAMI